MRRAARDGFASLTVADAARLAHALGGSLDWLAGRQPDPGPPAGAVTRLDAEAIRGARLDAAVSETALRAATGCTLSAWRMLLSGRYEPTLEIVVTLAGVLDRGCTGSCRCCWRER